jgi:hypothetical protein
MYTLYFLAHASWMRGRSSSSSCFSLLSYAIFQNARNRHGVGCSPFALCEFGQFVACMPITPFTITMDAVWVWSICRMHAHYALYNYTGRLLQVLHHAFDAQGEGAKGAEHLTRLTRPTWWDWWICNIRMLWKLRHQLFFLGCEGSSLPVAHF